MRKFCFLAALLLVSFSVYAQDIPQATGWINDFAGVLSPEYKEKIGSLIQELEEKTSAEIAIATVSSIAPYDEKEYARMLFDKWKPGKKGKDNGVLVLLAVKERRWRIETGYGVEGILPDGLCGQIGRDYMVPYFKNGNYSEGLYYGVAAIARIIAKEEKANISGLKDIRLGKKSRKPDPFLYVFLPVFFFIWNLPWPFLIGALVTLFFIFVFFSVSPLLSLLILIAYILSLTFRYSHWSNLPPKDRHSFFGPQNYGGDWSSSGYGGGFGGSGFGGGGFGGGGGGGGGAGGGF